jgi:NtrC-family two-component system sensor histidine kinase KinB
MKIKKKLLLGFGLLFVVVIIFGVVSIYYIKVISEASSITLKNNYATLTYTRQMRAVLDENDLPLKPAVAEAFNQALKKQENNITEPGENGATAQLRKAFVLLSNPVLPLNQQQLAERNARQELKTIEGLNMHAIELKNNYTHSTVRQSTVYLGGMVFITFLILFVLIVNFPGFILNPLEQLADALQQVSVKNYNTRLQFKTSDEFARLAETFNTMATELAKQENTSLSRQIAAELRLKTLAEEMPHAVIGLNEKQEILFINQEAKKMLNLNEKPVIGQSVTALSESNELLKILAEGAESPLKASGFQHKKLKVTVPNLKPDLDALTVASYPAGTIHIFKSVGV